MRMRRVKLSRIWAIAATWLAAALAFASPALAQHEPPNAQWMRYPRAVEVQVRDVAAIVRVTPQARPDVAVAIVNAGPLPTPTGHLSRNKLVLDGDLRRRVSTCRAIEGGGFEAFVEGRGWIGGDQLPVIYLRVPREAVIATSGAAQLHVARADTLDVAIEGCGDVDLEGASGAANVALSGAGPGVRLYDAGQTSVSVAGVGDVVLGVVREGLTVSIAGQGDVVAARVNGPTSVAIQGAGDVTIRDGHATTLSVVIAGSGDVTHNGYADRLDAAIFGGGDVRVARVDGPVSRRIFGGGDVQIGQIAQR